MNNAILVQYNLFFIPNIISESQSQLFEEEHTIHLKKYRYNENA